MFNKEDFNDDIKDVGEFGVGYIVIVIYEIILMGVKIDLLVKVDDLKY